jgi:hypothetical protein
MADTKKIRVEIEMDAKGAIKGIKGLGKESDKLAKKTNKNSKKMKRDWASTVTGINQGLELAKKGFEGLKKLFDLRREFLQYKQGMDALARNTGQNADMIVSKLKEVSDGTVANKDLMLAANRAVALNVTKDVDKMAQLMDISRLKAKAMGIDTTQAFNDMVTGIGRGSPLILDNLGIITKGWAEEAKAAGVAMDAQFILNKVLKDGAEELKRAGDQTLTGAEKIDKMKASFENLKLGIGEFIKSPAVQGVIKFITDVTNGISEMIKMQTELSKQRQKEIDIIGKGNDITQKQKDAVIDLGAAESDLVKVRDLLQRQRKALDDKKQKGQKITEAELNSLSISIDLYNENASAVAKARKGIGSLSITSNEAIEIFKKWSVEMDVLKDKSDGTIKGLESNSKSVTEFTQKELDARKEAWTQYYTFIGDQRTLDMESEKESFIEAQNALLLLREQNQIGSMEFKLKEEELQIAHLERLAEIDMVAKEEQIERDRIANEMIGLNFAQLTVKQKLEVKKQVEQQKKAALEMQQAWHSAVGNAVNDFSSGMTDMIFATDGFKKSFGTLVKDVLIGIAKMIVKFIIMKTVMSALGGVGLLFKNGGMVPQFGTGGPISGPSHSQGGVKMEAEGGEYMIRKESVTAQTLPILRAINSGMTNLASMSMASIPKFADGGPVNNTTNSTQNKTANIGSLQIVNPNPKKLFDQFIEYAEDMGVNLVRRG